MGTHYATGLRLIAPFALFTLVVAGCGGAATVPDDPRAARDGSGSGDLDPDACGNYAASDAGRKLYAFLQATVWLQDEVKETEAYLHDTCQMMADELGMARPTGHTQEVCNAVLAELDDNLEAGLSARAALEVTYEPAVCQVSVEAAASAAAECEGSASAEVVAQCTGTCQGTCQGRCDGECVGGGSAGTGGGDAGGECAGECHGTCEGSCEGSCAGHADVQAEASCQAHAEVRANTEATCTEPEIHVSYGAEIVADTERLEAAVAAIEAGLPRMLGLHARLTGPVGAAFTTWARAAAELGSAGRDVARGLGDSALCVAGQLSAAAAAIASIEASISVQIEVSASASASAGGGA
jgi:hypothetical protein